MHKNVVIEKNIEEKKSALDAQEKRIREDNIKIKEGYEEIARIQKKTEKKLEEAETLYLKTKNDSVK